VRYRTDNVLARAQDLSSDRLHLVSTKVETLIVLWAPTLVCGKSRQARYKEEFMMNQAKYGTQSKQAAQSWKLFVAFASMLALVACMSSPVAPKQELQSAEQAINQAENARVADYSSTELRSAREKLTAAKAAVHKEDMTLAKRLAEQSKVEADLALAKAQVEKAKLVNNEIIKGTKTMEEEMNRNRGDQQ